MFDRSETSQPELVAIDLIGDGSGAGLEGRPVLSRPVGHIRSPIAERRSVAPPLDPHRPSVAVPPIRTFIGPLIWALVPSVAALVRVGWQAAIFVGIVAIVVREARLRANRSTISFADGFLAYAGMNRWPHGVQEDDDVHWNWSVPQAVGPGQRAGG